LRVLYDGETVVIKVLVIGSGGREHALCWALASSPQVERIYCAPGNAGIAEIASLVAIKHSDADKLVDFARREGIDLTVIGPEAPLVAGLADRFAREKLRVFGPTAAAAKIEGSKSFAKEFMRRHHIPTAPFAVFDNFDRAREFVGASDGALVVKADGLAAGKGVLLCRNAEEATAAVKKVMVERAFGAAGERVVIESRLEGEELSLMAFSDGKHVAPMVPARDYKAAQDGDRGPNTGGMGAYAPAMQIDDPLYEEIVEGILQRAIDGMAAEGTPYVGVLYAGLMLTEAGPRVLEFNCRFGDPETQVVLPLLRTDLVDVIGATLAGQLPMEPLSWHDQICVCVVLASRGYPGKYDVGVPITGPLQTSSKDSFRFHAGTRRDGDGIVTAGGRVLGVCARAATHESAVAKAYGHVEEVHFKGVHYRSDIGLRQGHKPRGRRPSKDRRAKV
jgi:phosphoribosylamine--glycine ligase